ncbi:MAG: hypothetical protein F4X79_08235 [Acidobacteria bacterium]|nr:hypothetical protein [Acidobacteriota bacterium]
MTLSEAVRVLVLGAGRAFPVIDRQGLRTLFAADGDHAFNAGLRRLTELGLLERLARGVYQNRAAPHPGRRGLGVVARYLRPGHLCYVSYESALAEFGSISQVPMVTLVATTGNGGERRSPFGDLEFCHTSRSEPEILANTVFDDRLGLRFASPGIAYEDLARVRPENLHLVDQDVHAEVLAEWERAAGPMREPSQSRTA